MGWSCAKFEALRNCLTFAALRASFDDAANAALIKHKTDR
jgi:hypothetical protein